MFDVTDSMSLDRIVKNLGKLQEKELKITKKLDAINEHLVTIVGLLYKATGLLEEEGKE
ncbi:MAG: hypothetical protein IIZ39_04940 [Blautia sp.]|nr:hypothetical protein [Blautia sp.]